MTSKNTTTQQQSSQQNQQSKSLIDPRVEGTYLDLANRINTGLASIPQTQWSGPAVAGGNSFDNKSIFGTDQILQAIQGSFNPGTFTNIALDAASGRLMDPATNPTLKGMIDASIQPITEKLNRQIIPGLDNASIMDNAFGGDRAALTKGQAYGDWAESAGNISAGLNYDNYTRERQNQLNSAQLFQDALGAEVAIPSMYAKLGDYQRMLDQKAIDDKIMQQVLAEQFAFSGLGTATSLMNALPFVGQQSSGTSSSSGTTTQVTKQDPLTAVAQGALGLGSTMAGLGWTPFGSQASAAASAPLLGASSALAGSVGNPMATGYVPPYMLNTLQGLR